MNEASTLYFHRAAWAWKQATGKQTPAVAKAHFTAMSLHACQSLRESLDHAAEFDEQLAAAVKELPHTKLIENVRNMDIHGWPLPICDPDVTMRVMKSKPGSPIRMSSSRGVTVSMQMDGLKPRTRRSPNDLKGGGVKPGGATVSYGCSNGTLYVHDFSTAKVVALLEALRSFLERSQVIISERRQREQSEEAGSPSPTPRPPKEPC